MSPEKDQLEQALSDLTSWTGDERDLARRALVQTQCERHPLARWFTTRVPMSVAAAVLVLVVGATIVISMPTLSRARDVADANSPALREDSTARASASEWEGSPESPPAESLDAMLNAANEQLALAPETMVDISALGREQSRGGGAGIAGDALALDFGNTAVGTNLLEFAYRDADPITSTANERRDISALNVLPSPSAAPRARTATPSAAPDRAATRSPSPEPGAQKAPAETAAGQSITQPSAQPAQPPAAPPVRYVISKANITLHTDDVRSAYLSARLLLNPAFGEYVGESSIRGTGIEAQAELTLRVAANRLSVVLDAVRKLGVVESEQLVGDDVTAQMVDLEARLRNEQRVEAELLELLQSRQNAPLDEILQLRASLSRVRADIERLTAQRSRIAEWVRLATVLVIIRAPDAPDTVDPQPTLGAYFRDALSNAARIGLRALSDSLAFVIAVLVGGALWWVLLAIALSVAWRLARRAQP